jgi:NAD-dependent dihydropyrimidine dehydrogenase PreA subunit
MATRNKRKIVRIDPEKCNGCGLCISACAEGAIQLVDGKARLVSDSYCDGLGACLGECPQDAISIEEREADAFDEEAVKERMHAEVESTPAPAKPACNISFGGCPGSRAMNLVRDPAPSRSGTACDSSSPSELSQWPVQLHLVPVNAPYWKNAELLIAADCTAFAAGGFHPDLLKGKKLVIACPKLDDTSRYIEKIRAILEENEIRSLTVAHMEVPCCTGILRMAQTALEQSGKAIPFHDVTVRIDGTLD